MQGVRQSVPLVTWLADELGHAHHQLPSWHYAREWPSDGPYELDLGTITSFLEGKMPVAFLRLPADCYGLWAKKY